MESERRFRTGEENFRIENVILRELEFGSVKLTRATFRDHVDHGAGAAAKLRAVAAGENADLADRVYVRCDDRVRVTTVIHVVGAVDGEIDGVAPHAIDTLRRGGERKTKR